MVVNYNWYTYSEKLSYGFRNCVNLCIVQSEKFYCNMVSYLCVIGQWHIQEFCLREVQQIQLRTEITGIWGQ